MENESYGPCQPVTHKASQSVTNPDWFDESKTTFTTAYINLHIQEYITFSTQLIHSLATISALVNLIYVCAASVQPDFNSLALNISGFNLDYYSDRDVIGDLRVFAAAQKFQRVQKLAQAEASTMAIVHNVPEYDLNAIQDLTDVMHDSLAEYSKADTIQQEQIRSK